MPSGATNLPPGPSASVEDYLKAIYSLSRSGQRASTTKLAERLGFAPSSVSTMVSRLAETDLADYVPYEGVRLTGAGEREALRVIRRHRLLEAFLASSLGIPWDEVHAYAEQLEHSASDELIELIAAKLGDPSIDPHGDPIPTRELTIEEGATECLTELEPGGRATIVRVSDSDPEMLRYLNERQIGIGDELRMLGRDPFDGPYRVRIGGGEHRLGPALARAIRVHPGDG